MRSGYLAEEERCDQELERNAATSQSNRATGDIFGAGVGGSGSLLLCRLMDVLGIPTVLVPPDPGNVSAFGLLTVDVKNDYVQTQVALDPALDLDALRSSYDGLAGQAC